MVESMGTALVEQKAEWKGIPQVVRKAVWTVYQKENK